MSAIEPGREKGWSGRVAFSDDGTFAYRRGELLVAAAGVDVAREVLGGEVVDRAGSFVRLTGVDDPVGAVADLRPRGVHAQPNHVLFSHCGCCCGPHPSVFAANPFQANPFQANPFQANPFQANPFQANPFQANPFQANPFQANPFQANPFQANPTGQRPHSARPATEPDLPKYPGDVSVRTDPRIVVVDTGLAVATLRPHALDGLAALATDPDDDERPDEDVDDVIDPVAGHGTFIAGIIERIAPGCALRVDGLLTGYGDASEFDVAATLDALAADPPHLVNLSFGGYTPAHMDRLGEAVRGLQRAGTVIVASAGNDATCVPAYPAAFPGVVAVGALGPWGAAPFTNYGPWVRACAPGVDVVSTFFTEAPPYAEWVSWSGTSFAAPAVVGALARAMREGFDAAEAVARVIDAPGLFRIPNLGTVVNEQPRWRIS